MRRAEFLARVLGGLMALVGVRKAEPEPDPFVDAFKGALGKLNEGLEATTLRQGLGEGPSPDTATAALNRYREIMGTELTERFDAEARTIDKLWQELGEPDDLPGNRFIVEIEP